MKTKLLLAIAILGLGTVTVNASENTFGGATQNSPDSTSRGSALHCEGNYFNHDFTVDGSVSGNRIPGQVRFAISSNGNVIKTGLLTVTSSSVLVGKSIQFMASGSDGTSGELSTAYDPSVRTYGGTLHAHSPQGNVDVPVQCTIGNSRSRHDRNIYW